VSYPCPLTGAAACAVLSRAVTTSASTSTTSSVVEAGSAVEDDACRICRAHAEHGCSRDASLDGPGRERHCKNELVEEVAMKDMVEAGTWTKSSREQEQLSLYACTCHSHVCASSRNFFARGIRSQTALRLALLRVEQRKLAPVSYITRSASKQRIVLRCRAEQCRPQVCVNAQGEYTLCHFLPHTLLPPRDV
jgi:hypothetical protein